MYLVTIKTIYNTIRLEVEDIKEVEEILNQPYIVEVYIETMDHYIEEEKKKLLRHVVGMTYNTEKVLKLMKKKGD